MIRVKVRRRLLRARPLIMERSLMFILRLMLSVGVLNTLLTMISLLIVSYRAVRNRLNSRPKIRTLERLPLRRERSARMGRDLFFTLSRMRRWVGLFTFVITLIFWRVYGKPTL